MHDEFKIVEQLLISHLTARLVHPTSGRTYHTSSSEPRSAPPWQVQVSSSGGNEDTRGGQSYESSMIVASLLTNPAWKPRVHATLNLSDPAGPCAWPRITYKLPSTRTYIKPLSCRTQHP